MRLHFAISNVKLRSLSGKLAQSHPPAHLPADLNDIALTSCNSVPVNINATTHICRLHRHKDASAFCENPLQSESKHRSSALCHPKIRLD